MVATPNKELRRAEHTQRGKTLLGAASLWNLVHQRVRVLTFPHISLISPNRLNPANTLNPLDFRGSHPNDAH